MCQSLVFTIAQTCSGNRALKPPINAVRHGNNFDHVNSVISVSNAGCLGDFQRRANRRSDESSDDPKKVMRREKNRIAAQKSRLRQTQKADSLHLESENLEKENAALRKEVKQLTEEAKYLSSVLSSHEPLCTGLAPQTPDLLYPPHHSSYSTSQKFGVYPNF
ncbi:unnamed protein product [Oreochromis niloticus]|nr:unnamed protein product [Mustela putorius furo]